MLFIITSTEQARSPRGSWPSQRLSRQRLLDSPSDRHKRPAPLRPCESPQGQVRRLEPLLDSFAAVRSVTMSRIAPEAPLQQAAGSLAASTLPQQVAAEAAHKAASSTSTSSPASPTSTTSAELAAVHSGSSSSSSPSSGLLLTDASPSPSPTSSQVPYSDLLAETQYLRRQVKELQAKLKAALDLAAKSKHARGQTTAATTSSGLAAEHGDGDTILEVAPPPPGVMLEAAQQVPRLRHDDGEGEHTASATATPKLGHSHRRHSMPSVSEHLQHLRHKPATTPRKQRRKSVLEVVLGDLSAQVQGSQEHTHEHLLVEDDRPASDAKILLPDYLREVAATRAEALHVERISSRHNILTYRNEDGEAANAIEQFLQIVKEANDPREACAAFLQAHYGDFVRVDQQGMLVNIMMRREDGQECVPLSFVTALFQHLSPKIKTLQRGAKTGLIIRCVAGILVTYSDLFSDIYLGRVYYFKGQTAEAFWTLGIVGFSLVAQAVFSWASRQGAVDTVLSLLGVKPLVDLYRVATGARRRPGAMFNPEMEQACSRGIEGGLESFPQTAFQMLVLLRNPYSSTVVTQVVTLATSCIAFGFIVANGGYDIDMSAYYRRIEPLVYGYYSLKNKAARAAQFVCTALLCCFTIAARTFAMAMLGLQSGALLGSWLLVEFLVIVLMRVVDGSFHMLFTSSHLLGGILSLIFFILYQSAPVLLTGNVYFGTPQLYRRMVGWFLLSNFLMCLASFSWTDASTVTTTLLPVERSLGILGGLTFAIVLCFVGIWCAMEPAFRATYLKKVMHPKDHFRTYIWVTYIYDEWGSNMDDHRACALDTFIVEYWWREGVMEWLEEKWEMWLALEAEGKAPSWFDCRWRAKIPLDMLPVRCRDAEREHRGTEAAKEQEQVEVK